jgi:hypothetical protein
LFIAARRDRLIKEAAARLKTRLAVPAPRQVTAIQ